jgi:hypothetical protein
MVARLGKVVGWTIAGAAIVLSSAAIFLVVTSADPILSKTFEATGCHLDLGAWREVGKNNGLLMPTHWKPLPT